jgi:cyclase
LGAGELLINSIDADGTRDGFDVEMIRAIQQVTHVPLIASGGAGKAIDFIAAADSGADAMLAASIFHDGSVSITEVKNVLKSENFEVRLQHV